MDYRAARAFADIFGGEDNCPIVVECAERNMNVTNPFMDESYRKSFSDEEAVEYWGEDVVNEYERCAEEYWRITADKMPDKIIVEEAENRGFIVVRRSDA